jgi:hypothetical protein
MGMETCVMRILIIRVLTLNVTKVIKSRRINCAYEEIKNVCNISGRKPEGKMPTGRTRSR